MRGPSGGLRAAGPPGKGTAKVVLGSATAGSGDRQGHLGNGSAKESGRRCILGQRTRPLRGPLKLYGYRRMPPGTSRDVAESHLRCRGPPRTSRETCHGNPSKGPIA